MNDEEMTEDSEVVALFGANKRTADLEESSFIDNIRIFFTLQRRKFWIYTYLLSIIYFAFRYLTLYMPINLLLLEKIIIGANVILFPFTLLLVGGIARRIKSTNNFIYRWLDPAINKTKNKSTLKSIIWYGTKLFFYFILWRYTFIIGVLGLVVWIRNAKLIGSRWQF